MRRARRAWTVLNKAVEIDGRGLWDLEALLVGAPLLEGEQPDPAAASKARKQYLQEMQGLNRSAVRLSFLLLGTFSRADRTTMVSQSPAILLEYVLHLLAERRFQQALAELDLYLPTVPYALDPTLHENAGMVALMLAQETSRQTGIPVDEEEDDDSDDERLPKVAQDGPRGVDDQRRLKGKSLQLRSFRRTDPCRADYLASLSESTYHGQAIAHFNRALALDPSSEVARGYLQLVRFWP